VAENVQSRARSSRCHERLLDPILLTPLQKTVDKISTFLLSLNPTQPTFHFILTPTLDLFPNPLQLRALPPPSDPPRFNEDVPSVMRSNEPLRLEIRDQRVLIFHVGVQSNVHPVTEVIDIVTLVGQPVFKCGEVLEEKFPRQGLVPTLLAGDVKWDRPGQVGRLNDPRICLCDTARSARDRKRRTNEQQSVEGVKRGQRHGLPIYWEQIIEVRPESLLPLGMRVSRGICGHNRKSPVGRDTPCRVIVRVQWVQEGAAVIVSRMTTSTSKTSVPSSNRTDEGVHPFVLGL